MNRPGNAWLLGTAHFIQVNSLPVRRIFNMEHFEALTDEDLCGKAVSDAVHGVCGIIRIISLNILGRVHRPVPGCSGALPAGFVRIFGQFPLPADQCQ